MLEVSIFANGTGYPSYWVEIPGIEGVVVFSEGCDCGSDIEEDIQSIQQFLKTANLL
jgi:hypothetical protein